MGCYVLGFQEIDPTHFALVGGKGAHLGELSRIDGIRVPAGFCVTTRAFQRIVAEAPSIEGRFDRLSRLKADDRDGIRALSADIRSTLDGIAIPDDLAAAITRALARLGEHAAYAVRSSATAEDLPTASFAGQQDTYLNVVGPAAILEHVSRCWASLFTERAVTYRIRNGFDHRKVQMAVVVQQMVFPQAAGILFTADPVTSRRRWGWRSSTSRTRSARIRRWWRFCSGSRTRVSWTSCPSSQAGRRRETPSGPTSTITECAAPARLTSPGRAGANAPPRSCP
jgi:rifampicin phosphotransferase